MNKVKAAFLAGGLYQQAREYMGRQAYLPEYDKDLIDLIIHNLKLSIHYCTIAKIDLEVGQICSVYDDSFNLQTYLDKYLAIKASLPDDCIPMNDDISIAADLDRVFNEENKGKNK